MEERLLIALTKMFGIRPIYYEDFNKIFVIKDVDKLRALEEEYDEIGISGYETENEGISVVSIIGTISRFLLGDAIAFNTVKVKDNTGKERLLIAGVCMYDKEISKELKTLTDQNVKRFMMDYGVMPCKNTSLDDLILTFDINKDEPVGADNG